MCNWPLTSELIVNKFKVNNKGSKFKVNTKNSRTKYEICSEL